jgi:hypothetical protein
MIGIGPLLPLVPVFAKKFPTTVKSLFTSLVQAAVDLRDLRHPTSTLLMLEFQDLGMRPMKVICNVRYLVA